MTKMTLKICIQFFKVISLPIENPETFSASLYASRRDSLLRSPPVMIRVAASVTGAASQTPVIPNRAGSVKIQASKTTSPRAKEIAADSAAFPTAVN